MLTTEGSGRVSARKGEETRCCTVVILHRAQELVNEKLIKVRFQRRKINVFKGSAAQSRTDPG